MGQISKLFPEESILLQNLMPVVLKVSIHDFLIFFGRITAENSDSVFLTGVRPEPGLVILRCDQMGQISKFLP